MKKVELILCVKCSGEGVIQWDELVDYHKNDYETHTEPCKACNGSGRLVKTIETTYKPFEVKKG